MRWNVCSLVLLCVVVVMTQDTESENSFGGFSREQVTKAIFCKSAEGLRLKVVTIATDETDGYKRFMRSAKMFDIDVEVGGACDLRASCEGVMCELGCGDECDVERRRCCSFPWRRSQGQHVASGGGEVEGGRGAGGNVCRQVKP